MSSRLLDASAFPANTLPVWDLQAKRSGFRPTAMFEGLDEGDLDVLGIDPASGSNRAKPEAQPEPTGPSIEEQIAEAYRRGFDDGHEEASVAAAANEASAKVLVQALTALKPQLSDTLCSMLLESFRTLLSRTVGFSEPDTATLQKHCEALAALVSREMSGAKLHLHPEDLAMLGDSPCGLTLVGDVAMRRGTVCLVHDDGWIEQGTQPLLDELQGLIDSLGNGQ